MGTNTRHVLSIFLGTLIVGAIPAHAGDASIASTASPITVADTVAAINGAWLAIATVLVLFMQVGFLLLESGLVRAKNSINIAQKNLADVFLATLLFSLFGFSIMFGPTVGGLWGFEPEWLLFADIPPELMGAFFFQAVFCGTAATLVSGAVAERMSLVAFLCVAALIAGFIYPVVGHWVWGDAILTDQSPLLVSRGFVDFAGATVVHSVGAWVALAAILIIGPRIGKFRENGTPLHIQGHNMVLAASGGLFLWIGWLGFNGGALSPFDPNFATVLTNTFLAGAIGGLVHMVFGHLNDRLFRPGKSINGIISGLVAVTACVNIVDGQTALLIGAIGSFIGLYLRIFLEWVMKLDDPVSVVAVHGCVGVWGTLAVALFGDLSTLPHGTRTAQLAAQAEGVAISFAWAFGVSYLGLKAIDTVLKSFGSHGLRVPAESERMGLNYSEHAATFGTGELQKAMQSLETGTPDWTARVSIEPGDESAELGATFNKVMDRFEADYKTHIAGEKERTAKANAAFERERELNQMQQKFVSMVSHEFRTPVTIIDSAAQRLDRRKDRLKTEDIDKTVSKVRSAVRRMTALIDSTLSASKLEAGSIRFSPQKVDIATLIRECCDAQQDLSREHNILLELDPLPETISADPLLLTQIFTNLLSNAVKYSPDNPDILVTGKAVDGQVVINVADQGLGIPDDEMDKLFTRFFRARTSTGIAGTGVGLNVVKEFCEMHGGKVTVTSQEGRGTTFRVTLPAAATQTPSGPEARPMPDDAALTPNLARQAD